MTFKDFYFNEFRPVYLIDFVRSVLEYDLIITKNCSLICDKELTEIRLNDIDKIIKQADENYSFSRAKKVRSFVKRVMKNAYANRFIDFDLSAFEFRKLKHRTETELQLYTKNQLDFLLSGSDYDTKMFRFLLLTGLRREEILGLEWKNVNLNDRTIYICQTVVIINNKNELVQDTKSHKFRYIPLCQTAYNLLLTLDTNSKFVFHNDKNSFICVRSYQEKFKHMWNSRNEEYRKRLGKSLPYLTAHKLRHSFASTLINDGVDIKTTSSLLGHSTTDTTQIYLHSSEYEKKKAVDVLNDLI